MKQLPILTVMLAFTLAACGATTAPSAAPQPSVQQPATHNASTTPGTDENSSDDERAVSVPTARAAVQNVAGVWTYKVDNADYTFPFEGRIEWTENTTQEETVTVKGRRFVCNGTSKCTENGTATLTFDGKSIQVRMTETTENCPPQPGEACETLTGLWLEGMDANDHVDQHDGKSVISGKANVHTRKPQVDVHFELRSR